MSTIIKNIPAQSVSSPVVLGMNTNKKVLSANTSYSNYTAAGNKKWYRQSSEKLSSFDWDINKSELEFE